uniref:Uncharacterized protein n=1 Tax=Heliothis virescens TaxID=7102 RepID=A0A2A4K6G5_HELVI
MAENNEIIRNTKKRKQTGRMSDVLKKLRLQGHEIGDDCKCNRFKCFEMIREDQKTKIIRQFNSFANRYDQDNYLSGLITVSNVQRRRPRVGEENAKLHNKSYSYKIRMIGDDTYELPVCRKAFISLHGITGRRLQFLQKSLTEHGVVQKDKRGIHVKTKISALTTDLMYKQIDTLKTINGKKGHYNLRESQKIYLSDELNLSKIHKMYNEKNPDNKVSYETYRNFFNKNFNISFGYPRMDTCSTCDEFQAEKKHFEIKIASLPDGHEKSQILSQLRRLEIENLAHKKRAEVFYDKKRKARLRARQDVTTVAITMDFSKNLPVPNITTNDVYYKRQLSYFMFNVHVLADSSSYFFAYNESIGKKGSDDVASHLFYFIFNEMEVQVKTLIIFCDSCGGQNKNYTIFRMLHYIVHCCNRLESVTVIFPIRGHSYMECDRNMAYLNQKTRIELPEEWAEHVRGARQRPKPFNVIECSQDAFKGWTTFLKPFYKKTCPFPIRPMREFRVQKEHPRLMFYRNFNNSPWESSVVNTPVSFRSMKAVNEGEFKLPGLAYKEKLPISTAKYNDLQSLKKFCRPETRRYYDELPHAANIKDSEAN